MTPGDLYAVAGEIESCDGGEAVAGVLARALRLDFQQERDLAFILGAGDFRTYKQGVEEGEKSGYESGKEDARDERGEQMDAARDSLVGLAKDLDKVEEALKNLDDVTAYLRERVSHAHKVLTEGL